MLRSKHLKLLSMEEFASFLNVKHFGLTKIRLAAKTGSVKTLESDRLILASTSYGVFKKLGQDW